MDPVGDFVHICEKDLELIDSTPSLRLRFEKGMHPVYRDFDEDSSDKEEDELSIRDSVRMEEGNSGSKGKQQL